MATVPPGLDARPYVRWWWFSGPVEADELYAVLPVLLRLRWAVRADRAARRGRAEELRRAREALEGMPG